MGEERFHGFTDYTVASSLERLVLCVCAPIVGWLSMRFVKLGIQRLRTPTPGGPHDRSTSKALCNGVIHVKLLTFGCRFCASVEKALSLWLPKGARCANLSNCPLELLPAMTVVFWVP